MKRYMILVFLALVLLAVGCGSGSGNNLGGSNGGADTGDEENGPDSGDNGNGEDDGSTTPDYADLPDISAFLTTKSDRFLIDVADMDYGHPMKGLNSNSPHGAHIHFTNDGNEWPRDGVDLPENYPPVYAVADGYVYNVQSYYQHAGFAQYRLNIVFVTKDGDPVVFSAGCEPMIDPGDETFYERYILVENDQYVHKGDILGYMYIPPGADTSLGTHIHFGIQIESEYAPAIFTIGTVQSFKEHWGDFGYDPDPATGVEIPACMGYKITAEQNPFGTGASDCLN